MSAFDKIIGYENEKRELNLIIDMFEHEDIYKAMGAGFPRNILIYGIPGVGKTMLAEAMIEECKVKSFTLRKNKDESETIKEITNTFEAASKEDKAIIFIDDIDKFSEANVEDCDDESFVAIQSGIDSVKNKNVLVIATANNYQKLPASIRRAGRFDIKIALDTPSYEDGKKIIEYYLKDKKIDQNLNFEDVAKMISYSSCAELENVINKAAIYATYARKDCINIDDIVKAYLKNEYNNLNDNWECGEEDLIRTCIHEAGHAVVAETIKKGCVGFISLDRESFDIINGTTHICDKIKRRPANVLIGLAGKVATELFYEGRCGSGCQSDLSKTSSMIRNGITDSGTCGLGLITVAHHSFSEPSQSLNERNEAVVQAEMERYMFLVRDILMKNKDFVMKLAESLKEHKYLLYSQIKNIRDSVKVTETIVQ